MAALSYRPLPRALAVAVGLAFLVLLAAGLSAARPVHAATTITVDTLSDGHLDAGATACSSAAAGGKCTLRAALELNDGNGGGSAITLGAGQIDLTLGELVTHTDVTITGTGSSKSLVSNDKAHRVFDISSLTAQVAMTGFAIVNGAALGAPAETQGGGIRNFGSLTLTDMDLQSNSASFGGGIADFGTLVLNRGTVVSANTAGVGGGLAEFGKLTSTGDVFSSNRGGAGGNLAVDFARNAQGQIVRNGTAAVVGATIAGGVAGLGGLGGGAFVNAGGSATFAGTTFVGNAVVAEGLGGVGGAIENECGALTLTNDTLDANTAEIGFGGALAQRCDEFSPQETVSLSAIVDLPGQSPGPAHAATTGTPAPLHATATLDFVTMADNAAMVTNPVVFNAPRGGNSIFNKGESSVITVHDTIVAGMKNGGPNCVVEPSGVESQGYNLENAHSCSFEETGDQNDVDPHLGALKDNGGPTQTMALTARTPAVDSADPKCGVATDQRGIKRPQGSRCDIGAFELQAATGTATPLPAPPVTGRSGRQGGLNPSLVALILAPAAVPAVGAGLWALRRRTR